MRTRLPLPLARRSAWAASVLWMAAIFGFSSLPGSAVQGVPGSYAHFGVYAVLGGLLFVAFSHETAPGRAAAYAVLTASLYGVTDELHQAFVPGRMPDAADWGMDTLGAFTGALLTLAVLRLLARRRERNRGA
jgi:VanZ family protein